MLCNHFTLFNFVDKITIMAFEAFFLLLQSFYNSEHKPDLVSSLFITGLLILIVTHSSKSFACEQSKVFISYQLIFQAHFLSYSSSIPYLAPFLLSFCFLPLPREPSINTHSKEADWFINIKSYFFDLLFIMLEVFIWFGEDQTNFDH